MKTTTTWHVFADGIDDWFDTVEQGKQAFDDLCKEYTNVRIYEEISEIDGDTIDEMYLDGQGEFPY